MVAPHQNRTAANETIPLAQREEIDAILLPRLRQALREVRSMLTARYVITLLCNFGILSLYNIIYMQYNASHRIVLISTAALLSTRALSKTRYAPRFLTLSDDQYFILSSTIVFAWTQTNVCDSTQSACAPHSSVFYLIFFVHALLRMSSSACNAAFLAILMALYQCILHYNFTNPHSNDDDGIAWLCLQLPFALGVHMSLAALFSWIKKFASRLDEDGPPMQWMILIVDIYSASLWASRFFHWKWFMAPHLSVPLPPEQ